MGAILGAGAKGVRWVGDFVARTLDGDFVYQRMSNLKDPTINKLNGLQKFTIAATSPLELISRYSNSEDGFIKSLQKTYLKGPKNVAKNEAGQFLNKAGEVVAEEKDAFKYYGMNNLDYGKIAGTASGLGIGGGIAYGLTHDSHGNTDIAGLPLI